jgi:hypothetical protein
MNKLSLIIIAGVIFLILALSWVYLIFYGKPDTAGELFANLGFGSATDPSLNVVPDTTDSLPDPVVDVDSSALQQLTTRPVVGFGVTNDLVRFMEEGTGHIYEIDLATGAETRLTNTTIPRVSTALFNDAADMVVFTIYEDTSVTNTIGTIPLTGDTTLETYSLPLGSENVAFLDNETLLYSVTGANTTLYTYDLSNRTTATVVSAPFWSINTFAVNGEALLINRFAENLSGAFFDANPFTALSEMHFGLTGFPTSEYLVYSYANDGRFVNKAADRTTGSETDLSLTALKEKCAGFDLNTLYCATPAPGAVTPEVLKAWYQGIYRFTDNLWSLDLSTGTGTLLVLLEETSGREIDLINPRFAPDTTALFFTNKNDNSLWRYEL